MDMLGVIALLLVPPTARFTDARSVDRYYEAFEQSYPRPISLWLVSVVAVVAVVLPIATLVPR